MAAQPFLAAHSKESTKCLLCAKIIADKKMKQTIGTSGLNTIAEKAAVWAKVQIPLFAITRQKKPFRTLPMT